MLNNEVVSPSMHKKKEINIELPKKKSEILNSFDALIWRYLFDIINFFVVYVLDFIVFALKYISNKFTNNQ